VRAVLLLLFAAACASHRHEQAARPDDRRRLYVEISAQRSHKRALRDGASAGLAKIPFVVQVPLDRGGDVELQVEVARLDAVGRETVCKIKILVLRLPQHDLFGMAEGNARAGGTHDQAEHDCVEHLGESLIGGKVRTMLHRLLGEKR
jgi:hypothetical protein